MAIVYTQDDLDAVLEALKTGAEEVQIGDRKIKYRSQADLLKLIASIQQQLEGTATSTTSTTLIQGTYRKGYSE